jgi:hypoxanthine-DNA glycosylase
VTRPASFAPIVEATTETLILGSLPGAASLAAGRYYAHPRNQFWRLLGAVIGEDLPALPYDERLAALRHHRIGLWDVVAEAERAGSLDAAIRNHAPNDLQSLTTSLPVLRTIGFNGATAARIGRAQLGALAKRYRLVPLPSSSPAHAALSFEAKLTRWLELAVA